MGFSRRSWELQGCCGVPRVLVGCQGGHGVLLRCYRTVSKPASTVQPPGGPQPRARRLAALLNRSLRVRMSDGRTLVGAFLCTDRDANIILGSAQEFLKAADTGLLSPADAFPGSEPRVLGLAMVPGHHIVSIEVERDAAAALCS
uniref:Sm domain-containing protein n=1 Tax=Pavo cristatus TaxID=9049 RepID=A0A8C9L5P4_PAVCR